MNRIQQLNSLLANQIAAGEVIERPASVVKELLENSLDAQASHIDIDIEKAGTQRIRIRDDGVGIHKEDLILAISRHATSKIRDLDDLIRIESLGFRGEALASISSISRLSLSSRTAEQESGWQICMEGRDAMPAIAPIAHVRGTTIDVQDLFFNTPARRKFLRTEKTEFALLEEVVKRMALSRFDVGFTLRHHDRVVYQLNAADDDNYRHRRIKELCGSAFTQKALMIDMKASGLRLWGWLAIPQFSRSQNDLQYFYVNGRIVRDKLIQHAMRQAYQDMPAGRHSAFILFLEVDPEAVDVNVHPTKHELRFHESRLIHDFIVSSVRRALAGEQVNIPYEREFEKSFSSSPRLQQSFAHYEALATPSILGRAIAQWKNSHFIAENQQGFFIVDTRTAYQTIIYQRLKQAWLSKNIHSQTLSPPLSFKVEEELADIIEEQSALLQSIGLFFVRESPSAVGVRQIPALLENAAIPELLQVMMSHLPCELEKILLILAENSFPMSKIFSLAELDMMLHDLEKWKIKNDKIWAYFSIADMDKKIKTS